MACEWWYGMSWVGDLAVMTPLALTKLLMLQVTGDDHVPAGKHTWHAQAAPMKQPWNSKEAALVDMQGQLLDQRADNLEHAVAAHKRVGTAFRDWQILKMSGRLFNSCHFDLQDYTTLA